MRTYRCQHVRVVEAAINTLLLSVQMLEHHANGSEPGSFVTTTRLRMIDFERGVALTQNSIYFWNPKETAA